MPNLKRPRESYSSQLQPPTASTAGKRVKFASDAPATSAPGPGGGDEDLDDLDLTDSTAARKRTAVVTDGYDSDSSAGSDGGFGVGGGRKGGKDKEAAADGDDDDMFGGGAEKEKVKAEKPGKEFLEMGDIEGQEFGRGDEGDEGEGEGEEEEEEEEEDYLPDDDLANDDDAPRSRRKKTGMGFKLSSFNMQDELAEGRFSTDGSYVANANDPLAKNDVWLDGVSKASIKAARASKKRMEDEARRREEDEAKGEGALAQQRDDCLIGMLSLVREGETVAGALARLGAAKKKVVRVKKPRAPAKTDPDGDDVMELDDDLPVPSSVSKGKGKAPVVDEDPAARKIELLTHYASTLLSAHGELEIYEQSYADIIKSLKAEGAVRRDWVPPKDPDAEREAAEAAAAAAAAASEAASQGSSGKPRPLIARPTTSAAAAKRFWYKWKSPPPGQPADQEYGPYGHGELSNWVAGGYFGDRGANVVVKVDGQDRWGSWEEACA